MTEAPDAATVDRLRSLAAAFASLGSQVEGSTTQSTLEAVVALATERLEAAAASVTISRGGNFRTAAATDDRARAADALQYSLDSGPCVDAIEDDAIFCPDDLAADPRWPVFGPRVVAEHGFASMLSYRLWCEGVDEKEVVAALNIYGEGPHAFDEADKALGLLLATHSGIALVASNQRERTEHLRRALENSRDIGVAIGVLMSQYKVTREQAFDLLRVASQRKNQKLHEIAREVADTGIIDVT